MKIIHTSQLDKDNYVDIVTGDTPGSRPVWHDRHEYFIDHIVEEGFLYKFSDALGNYVYVWNVYEDVWLCIDPRRQLSNGTYKAPTGQDDIVGYLDLTTRSFVYYLNKNACSSISLMYGGCAHSLTETDTCSVIHPWQLSAVNLSDARKWMVWRSPASRCASSAAMIMRHNNYLNMLVPHTLRNNIMENKMHAMSFVVGAVRASILTDEKRYPGYSLFCDQHIMPQSIGYRLKGIDMLGVDDIVPIEKIKKFSENEIGIPYIFKSSSGLNSGSITEDDIQLLPGFDMIESHEASFFNNLKLRGAVEYT